MANRTRDTEALGDCEREWLVFGNSCYYPEGGLDDLVGRYPNYRKAKAAFDAWLLKPARPPRIKESGHWDGTSQDCWAQLAVYMVGTGFIQLESRISIYYWNTKTREVRKAGG
jgi:hypothetical protein